MLNETSLSVARREPQEQLVVRASRKAELPVAAQFKNWLLENKYSELTSADYMGRIERLCRKEGYTLAHLVENMLIKRRTPCSRSDCLKNTPLLTSLP